MLSVWFMKIISRTEEDKIVK